MKKDSGMEEKGSEKKTILTINTGSSSVRLSLFREEHSGQLIRVAHTKYTHDIDNPQALLRSFFEKESIIEINAISHRIVHGGTELTRTTILDVAAEKTIEALCDLAPLHNRRALNWIEGAKKTVSRCNCHVGVFDTAFFADLPLVAAKYSIPLEIANKYNIRRYGFHGIAHRAMWDQWEALHPSSEGKGRIITLQLGSGCSVAAIKDGKPLDTSMGFSPLEGLIMATRCGDIDPSLILYLQEKMNLKLKDTQDLLNKSSGLLGLSGGYSQDMKALLESSNPEAQLAIEVYCYRIRKYIGAYLVVLQGVDGIIFGGGVGEHAPRIRSQILQDMEWSGTKIDPKLNENVAGNSQISARGNSPEVWVVLVDEDRILATEALSLFAPSKVK